ncbi:MAG: response regulator [Lachnospiraceae bacterium]|nr:response regulator [Lachnospiraceae bacterium]
MHTLLIVEDEKLIRQGIKTMIQRSGVPVEHILECNNGLDAMEVLKANHVDVMFTDIRMPKMDGIELVNAIQQLPEPPLTVAVSGYDDFSYAVEMLRKGVREYILKPVDRDQIKSILEKLNAELEEKQASNDKNKTIFLQQLKYYMTQPEMESGEAMAIEATLAEQFPFEMYHVCVLSATGAQTRAEKEYIFLGEDRKQEIYVVSQDYLETLLKEELMDRFVGVSEAFRSVNQLRNAFKQAWHSRKEAFWTCRSAVYYSQKKETGSGLELTTNMLEQIAQQLGTEKYADGLKALQRIFQNARLGSYGKTVLENGMEYLLEEILRTYRKVIPAEKSDMKTFFEIYGFDSLNDMEDELMGWLEQVCDTINSHFDDHKNEQKIKQAIAYIQKNYHTDLNMAVVSNEISMNYSLFSFMFKQYTGSNFVNYLKEIRIGEAKKLLGDTDMKIVEISQAVGYENEKHFMKTFKSMCGVSATEYRRNVQQGSK